MKRCGLFGYFIEYSILVFYIDDIVLIRFDELEWIISVDVFVRYICFSGRR